MGYRIGWQCFDTYEAATDYQMSQVIPSISADGKLLHPVKNGSKWLYQGQEVKPSFGSCAIEQEVQQGIQLGGMLVGLMCIAFCFKLLIKFIHEMFNIPAGTIET